MSDPVSAVLTDQLPIFSAHYCNDNIKSISHYSSEYVFFHFSLSDSYPQCTCWFPGLKYTTIHHKQQGTCADNESPANIKWSCKHQPLFHYYIHTQRLRQCIGDFLTYVTYNARLNIGYMGMILIELHTLWLPLIDVINLKYRLCKMDQRDLMQQKNCFNWDLLKWYGLNLICSDRPQEIPRIVTEKLSNTCPSSAAVKELFSP